MENTPFAGLYKWDQTDEKQKTIIEMANNSHKIDVMLNKQDEQLKTIDSTLVTVDERINNTNSLIQKSTADAAISVDVSKKADVKATEALEKSNAAITTSDVAKSTAEEVQSQFNQVIAEAGSSNPEVVLARGGEVTLNARLEKTAAQLADKAINKLNGKKWNALGDSITFGMNASVPYHQLIKNTFALSAVNNYGISGTEISSGGTSANPSFVERYIDMDAGADYITVFGGVNDFLHNVPMGDENSVDNENFYGALNNLCNGLLTNFTLSYVAFITPLPCVEESWTTTKAELNSRGLALEDYVNAIIKVCNKNNIPVLDLYHGSGFRPDISIFKTNFMPDGLHPNDAGHIRLSYIVSSFLENLNGSKVIDTTGDLLASDIILFDANGYYDSTEVESALSEIGLNLTIETKSTQPFTLADLQHNTANIVFALTNSVLSYSGKSGSLWQIGTFPSTVKELIFEYTTTNQWIHLGGNSDSQFIVVSIGGANTGKVAQFISNGNDYTIISPTTYTSPVVGDMVKVALSNGIYTFTKKSSGGTEYLPWFTINKTDFSNSYWTVNKLGFAAPNGATSGQIAKNITLGFSTSQKMKNVLLDLMNRVSALENL